MDILGILTLAHQALVDDHIATIPHIADELIVGRLVHGQQHIQLRGIGAANLLIGDNNTAAGRATAHLSAVGRCPADVLTFPGGHIDQNLAGSQDTLTAKSC